MMSSFISVLVNDITWLVLVVGFIYGEKWKFVIFWKWYIFICDSALVFMLIGPVLYSSSVSRQPTDPVL